MEGFVLISADYGLLNVHMKARRSSSGAIICDGVNYYNYTDVVIYPRGLEPAAYREVVELKFKEKYGT